MGFCSGICLIFESLVGFEIYCFLVSYNEFVLFPGGFEFVVYLKFCLYSSVHSFLMFEIYVKFLGFTPICYLCLCFLFYCKGSVTPCIFSGFTFPTCNYL